MRMEARAPRSYRLLMAILALGLAFSSATARLAAQEKEVPASGESEKRGPDAPEESRKVLAFRGGIVLDVNGEKIEDATLIVRLGRIDALLPAGAEVPPEAELVELGAGTHVLPVFINPLSQVHRLGSSVRRSQPAVIRSARARSGDSRRSRAVDQVKPEHEIYERLARSGYGAIALVPNNGTFLSGQAAVVRPRKTKEMEDLLIREDSYLYMGYGMGKPFRALAEREFKKAIDAAEKILKARAEKAKPAKKEDEKKAEAEKPAPKPSPTPKPPPTPTPGPRPPAPARPPSEEGKPAAPAKPPPPDPLVEVFLGEREVFLFADAPAVIDHSLRVLDRLPKSFDFVLVTEAQEEDVVERLAKRRGQLRGVVLEPRLGTIYDTSIYVNSARLFRKHGIPVAFVPMSDDVQGHEEIVFFLGEMVKTGLSPRQALRAVTRTPAELLGIDDRLGSLSPGKEASFAVYDGDPLCGNATLKKVFFLGEEVFPGPRKDADEDEKTPSSKLAREVKP